MAEGQYPKDLEDKINSIPILKENIETASKILGKKLKALDTSPYRFLEASTERDLRVRAYRIGANAIVNYDYKPDSGAFGGFRSAHFISYGTPVKFID